MNGVHRLASCAYQIRLEDSINDSYLNNTQQTRGAMCLLFLVSPFSHLHKRGLNSTVPHQGTTSPPQRVSGNMWDFLVVTRFSPECYWPGPEMQNVLQYLRQSSTMKNCSPPRNINSAGGSTTRTTVDWLQTVNQGTRSLVLTRPPTSCVTLSMDWPLCASISSSVIQG